MGFSKLMAAAFVGAAPLIKTLLKKGMDPLQTDIHGRSAIWWAECGWAASAIVRTKLDRLLLTIL